MVNIRVDKIT